MNFEAYATKFKTVQDRGCLKPTKFRAQGLGFGGLGFRV